MNTPTKTGIDAAKTTSKRVVQKTGDLRGKQIADKITSAGKIKSKNMKDKKFTYHQKKDSK